MLVTFWFWKLWLLKGLWQILYHIESGKKVVEVVVLGKSHRTLEKDLLIMRAVFDWMELLSKGLF